MEKVLSRVCHDSWRKSENKMSSKINQAELAFVLILGVCPRLEPKSSCRKSRCQRGESNEAKNRDSNPGDHDEVAKAHIKTPQSGVGSIHVSMTSKEFISSDTACQYEPGMRQIRSLRLNQL
jgi:hypothetical protein